MPNSGTRRSSRTISASFIKRRVIRFFYNFQSLRWVTMAIINHSFNICPVIKAVQAQINGKNQAVMKTTFFMANMLLNLSASANILLIKIERELPHIILSLRMEDTEFNPNIVGIVDTDATLTAGYEGHIIRICENYPLLVSSIVWADK